jgi:ribonuclease HI
MITVYFDGACEPKNPGGTASYGFIIQQDGKEIYREGKIVCSGAGASNNVAEYQGLINALRWLYAHKFQHNEIDCLGDSQLVINQMGGLWNINKGIYVEHALTCKKAITYFSNITFKWIPREQNIADDISKTGLRNAGIKFRIQPEEK